MGVCIETQRTVTSYRNTLVTPYMGVCIETSMNACRLSAGNKSHPIWVCVLKHCF